MDYTLSLDTLASIYGSQIIGMNPSQTTPALNFVSANGRSVTNVSVGGYTNTDNSWTVAQDGVTNRFASSSNPTTYTDSTYGTAMARWTSTDANADTQSYAVYQQAGGYIYQLTSQGGSGTTLALNSSSQDGSTYTLNHATTITENIGVNNIQGTTGSADIIQTIFATYYYNGSYRKFAITLDLSSTGIAANANNFVANSGATQAITLASNGTSGIQSIAWGNGGLHTVSINVNAAVMAAAKVYAGVDSSLGSAFMDMSNWTFQSTDIGIETNGTGNSATDIQASLNVQNTAIHYQPGTAADTGTTVLQVTGGQYTNRDTTGTTNSGTNTAVVMAGNTAQTLISQGNWDTVDLAGHTTVAYVANGASFNGNGGVLTEGGPGGVYIAGTYAGLYATINSASSVNARLTGYGAITGQGSSVNITGDNAGLTITGNTYGTYVGTYIGFSDGNFSVGNTMYARVNGGTYINNTGGNLNLTQGNGQDLVLTNSSNDGYSNVYGDAAGVLTISGSGHASIYGGWTNLIGSVEQNVSINISTASAAVHNNGGTLAMTGTGNGSLSYGGTGGQSTIVGQWGQAVATLHQGDVFNSIVGSDSSIVVQAGAKANVWAQGTANDVLMTQQGGTLDTTLGSGSSTIVLNTSSDATTIIRNSGSQQNTILLQHLQDYSIQQSFANGNTIINLTSNTAGVGNINLTITNHQQAIAFTNTNGNGSLTL